MKLGLVGGLGLAAGIYYYRRLVRAAEDDGATPQLVLRHADVRFARGLIAQNRLDELAAYLASIIGDLAGAGCEIAVVPAATPHVCESQLNRIAPLPLVSLTQAVREGLRKRGLRRIALFGTAVVVESDLFGTLDGLDVVRPSPSEVALIDKTYIDLVTRGGGTDEHHATVSAVARELIARERLDAVVLSGTDLSELFEKYPADFPCVDASDLHLDAILAALR